MRDTNKIKHTKGSFVDNELSKYLYKYITFISPFIKVLVIVIHFSIYIEKKVCNMNWLVILVLMWLIIFWLIVGFGWYFCGFMQMVIYVLAYMFITFGVFLLSLQGFDDEN